MKTKKIIENPKKSKKKPKNPYKIQKKIENAQMSENLKI